MKLRAILFFLGILVLSGCIPSNTSQENTGDGAYSSSAESVIATNVSYIGTISPLSSDASNSGATHLLTLQSGITVKMVSREEALSLDRYIGKMVQVDGGSIPQENGEILLRVYQVTLMNSSSSSLSDASKTMCGGFAAIQCAEKFTCVDDLTDDCDPEMGGADCAGVCVPSNETSSSSSLSFISSASSTSALIASSKSSSSPSLLSSSSLSSLPPASSVSSDSSVSSLSSSQSDHTDTVKVMEKQKYSSTLWTQQYCSTHMKFCIAAHKNWYFKSFGASGTSLWHVEFSVKPLENIGDGILLLDLKNGSAASAGGSHLGVTVRDDGKLIGFADFGTQHFELSAPPELREALLYMLQSITSSPL